MSPSYNHSYLSYKIARALDKDNKFNIHIEMTLDIEGVDYIPDIALYQRTQIDFLHDKIKSENPPVLIVEILSPKQPVNEITDKFEVYLRAGVQSCWLVIPPTKTVVLFHDIQHPGSYSNGLISDEALEMDISVEDIFA